MHGFYRIATCVPALRVADPVFNAAEIIRCAKHAAAEQTALILFPGLCITGSSCNDLFFQKTLLDAALEQTLRIAKATADSGMITVTSLPLLHGAKLYHCAAVLSGGRIAALTPEIHPGRREQDFRRIFSSGKDILNREEFILPGMEQEHVPFTNLVFGGDSVRIGIETGNDPAGPLSPAPFLTARDGANILLNPGTSTAAASGFRRTRDLVRILSEKYSAVYAYAAPGVQESTTDSVSGGQALLCENGILLAETAPFQRKSQIIYADADLDAINHLRLADGVFQNLEIAPAVWRPAPGSAALRGCNSLKYRSVSMHPFLPGTDAEAKEACMEIFRIQTNGLARRLESSGCEKIVVGISGGLDSALALLVAAESLKILTLPPENLIAVSMPGFGTTRRTKSNAAKLSALLECNARTIGIGEACLQHFSDIGHDPDKHDAVYENAQARERTQILMDIANREKALAAGTGDLSEIALGWCTYNADHMSMYNVNCGVPKTLVRRLVAFLAETAPGKELGQVLRDILATPVSPELLPSTPSGETVQETESILGAYDLHDFYLYHFLRSGAPVEKLRFLAEYAFKGCYPPREIDRTLKIFVKRFFSQQFKRSCMPDGPGIGIVSLSPRTGWKMPSDASAGLWLSTLSADRKTK